MAGYAVFSEPWFGVCHVWGYGFPISALIPCVNVTNGFLRLAPGGRFTVPHSNDLDTNSLCQITRRVQLFHIVSFLLKGAQGVCGEKVINKRGPFDFEPIAISANGRTPFLLGRVRLYWRYWCVHRLLHSGRAQGQKKRRHNLVTALVTREIMNASRFTNGQSIRPSCH